MEKLFDKQNRMTSLMFVLYLVIFFTIDYLNMPYPEMIVQEGVVVTSLHIILNGVMASLSTYLFKLHEGIFQQIGREVKGNNTPIYAALFGILTYGCTPCVISFFAAIGIQLSIVALPWAGLPYKLISLLILVVGIWFSLNQQKKVCKIG